MRSIRLVLLAVAALAAVVPAAVVGARQAETLVGSVGPGPTITLRKADGTRILNLPVGDYTVNVDDLGDLHNFHLLGPGVDVRTGVEEMGSTTFNVTFTDGRYEFLCDIHPDSMIGNFTVGNVAPPPPPPPPPPPAPPLPRPAATPRLFGSIGTAIALKNAAGSRIRAVKAGTYLVTVKDTSTRHNFHLTGMGVDRKTTLAGRSTATWRVRFVKGKVYTYRSDAAATLRGTFRAT